MKQEKYDSSGLSVPRSRMYLCKHVFNAVTWPSSSESKPQGPKPGDHLLQDEERSLRLYYALVRQHGLLTIQSCQ
jgi:hypothetical protein